VKKSSARIPCAWDRGNSAQPGALEDLPDRRRRDLDAQSGELAVDPPVAPGPVLPRQPQHHRPHVAAHRRRPEPPRCDTRAHRRRTMSRCQRKIVAGVTISRIAVSRSMGSVPASSASHGPVRPRQTRMSTRPLTLGDSELMAQHQDLRVLPPRLPARQVQHRHRTEHDQVDQLQAHKPKIIPPPPGQDLPARCRTQDGTDLRHSGHLPRSHRFSAPTSQRSGP